MASSSVKRMVVRYRGNVQGVGFRMTAVAQSRGLAVHGFVMNEPNGDVLMDVEGSQEDLDTLIQRIKIQMEDRIDDAIIDQRDPLNRSDGFTIRY
ncbi:Acylphosphatase [Rubripirellula amarantea]|uniref:acylphosphatase n=1 Tax=Rubripirellula amarantea TaxID=2527999 RepID=A0A5C5WHQ4_9BACT|nr:acylphosphatase [Rubripirellula amarantea]TWT50344.1 Acylphosphatase [Rubripirellula amarantea]